MTSQELREAREYEEASGKLIQEKERPAFHLSARTGRMNDPDGFSRYNGQYHMFFRDPRIGEVKMDIVKYALE